jgi:hypothetical protein
LMTSSLVRCFLKIRLSFIPHLGITLRADYSDWGCTEPAHTQGNTGTCVRPLASGKLNIRFMFCTA